MSLLEDIFLEDEAGEAQELERIIEGDEYDKRPRSPLNSDDNSEKDDEAEEDKRRVDPATTKTKREVKNPRFVLNPARLTGPRGIQVIPEHFKDFKFKGKGHEKEDLDLVLKKLEHWAYRLYPKFQFEDCLKKIETLGKKRPVMVHLHKIRSDQLLTEETVVQQDSSDDEAAAAAPPEEDEFDKLLQQQIELARATPAKPDEHTPVAKKLDAQTPGSSYRPTFLPSVPKATSSPSISDEQRERMLLNRKLAEERRLAKLRALNNSQSNTDNEHKGTEDTVAINNSVNTDLHDDENSKNNEGTVTKDDVTVNGNVSIVETDSAESDGHNKENRVVGTVTSDFKNTNINIDREMNENDHSDNDNLIFLSVNERHTNKNDKENDITEVLEDWQQDKSIDKQKKSRSYVIDSSDSDSDYGDVTINENVTVDIHKVASQVESASKIDSEIPTVDLVGADSTKIKAKVNDTDSEIIVIEDQVNTDKETTNEIEMVDLVGETDKPDKTSVKNTVEYNLQDCAVNFDISGKIDANSIVMNDLNKSGTIQINDDNTHDTNEEKRSEEFVETENFTKKSENKRTVTTSTVPNITIAHSDIEEVATENVHEIDSENTEISNDLLESNTPEHFIEATKNKKKINSDVNQECENIDDIMDVDFSDDF